jgi:3-(3-hydroxy-phenyl)propionate hydroxylase
VGASAARPGRGPAAVLIRPDGYVAWAGELAEPELPDALATWFGPPAVR